jgi:ribonuclease HI
MVSFTCQSSGKEFSLAASTLAKFPSWKPKQCMECKGGWGAVYVVGDKIIGEKRGRDPATTNDRMELFALRAALELAPVGTPAVIYSDNKLCVVTMNTWAKGGQAKGWKKKGGPIMNLELIQEIYMKLQGRPTLQLEWIAAHSGHRWNVYADALAT